MTPGDDTDAVVVRIDFLDGGNDLFRALAGREVLHRHGNVLVDIICHLFGMLRNVCEHVVAVKGLGTGQPINNFFFHFSFLYLF